MTYREQVVTFGADNGLVGIVTVPAAPRANAPIVVLLNAGIIHRVGANRTQVLFARAFADIGLTTLRFDLSGIGDSQRSAGALALPDVVKRDIAAALSFLSANHRGSHFILMGLCSGAYDAMHAALDDPRVTGVVMLDLPGPFRTWHHAAHHVARSLRHGGRWRKFVRAVGRVARSIVTPSRQPSAPARFVEGIRPMLPREEMGARLDTLLRRSVRLFFVFTPGVPDNYNHRGQFGRCFPQVVSHPNVRYEFFPDSDHTFSKSASRTRLIRLLREWVEESAPATPPVVSAGDRSSP